MVKPLSLRCEDVRRCAHHFNPMLFSFATSCLTVKLPSVGSADVHLASAAVADLPPSTHTAQQRPQAAHDPGQAAQLQILSAETPEYGALRACSLNGNICVCRTLLVEFREVQHPVLDRQESLAKSRMNAFELQQDVHR